MNTDFLKESAMLQAESQVAQLYQEAQTLRSSMDEYEKTYHYTIERSTRFGIPAVS